MTRNGWTDGTLREMFADLEVTDEPHFDKKSRDRAQT